MKLYVLGPCHLQRVNKLYLAIFPAIFLATKHEKTIMACNYLNFPYRKYIKTAKNGGFFAELLSENDFEAVLINFFCYEYIIVPMLLRQFRSED